MSKRFEGCSIQIHCVCRISWGYQNDQTYIIFRYVFVCVCSFVRIIKSSEFLSILRSLIRCRQVTLSVVSAALQPLPLSIIKRQRNCSMEKPRIQHTTTNAGTFTNGFVQSLLLRTSSVCVCVFFPSYSRRWHGCCCCWRWSSSSSSSVVFDPPSIHTHTPTKRPIESCACMLHQIYVARSIYTTMY